MFCSARPISVSFLELRTVRPFYILLGNAASIWESNARTPQALGRIYASLPEKDDEKTGPNMWACVRID